MVTIKDIARESGYSISTVSRVLNHRNDVSPDAKKKIEEVNDAGTYSAELITSADAAEQIVNIEDIIAAGEDNIAVVIQPIDDTVQSAIQQLVDAEIPYVAFDRIIEGVADSAVSNVKVTTKVSVQHVRLTIQSRD